MKTNTEHSFCPNDWVNTCTADFCPLDFVIRYRENVERGLAGIKGAEVNLLAAETLILFMQLTVGCVRTQDIYSSSQYCDLF